MVLSALNDSFKNDSVVAAMISSPQMHPLSSFSFQRNKKDVVQKNRWRKKQQLKMQKGFQRLVEIRK